MSKKTPAERLVMARTRAGYQSATDAARAFGWNENTYRSHENGERGIKQVVASKYARAFNVDAAFILLDEKYDIENHRGIQQIGGHVGSDGRVELTFKRKPGNFISYDFKRSETTHFAELPVSVDVFGLALEVTAPDISHPFLPGDLVIVEDEPVGASEIIGRWALVEVEYSEFYLRFVGRVGEDDYINIQASPRLPDKLVKPSWIGAVIAIVPAGAWHKETHQDLMAVFEEAEREEGE